MALDFPNTPNNGETYTANSGVRYIAIQNKNATPEHISKALNDTDFFVRSAAQTIAKRRGIIGESNG